MADKRDKPNSAWAVEHLRRLIFDGALAPGSDHLEGDLAVRLGLSRTPVREALVTLEGQGLVALRPRKGVRICPISPDDLAEIYDILSALESQAAHRAALRKPTRAALRGLSEAIAQMERALAENDLLDWADGDERFHREVARLGGNSRAEAIVSMMSDQLRRARLTTLKFRTRLERSNADHRILLDAIARGDATLARKVHRDHRLWAKAMMTELLQRHFLSTPTP